MDEQEQSPILDLRGINKRFGAVQALSEVDFEVFLNEVVGLVGDNGAGKSTLVKIIAGTYQPDSGHYLFEGREVSVNNPREATDLGIQTVYQDLALCDNLDVVANLYLGREEMQLVLPGVLETIDEIEMEQKSHQIINLSLEFKM